MCKALRYFFAASAIIFPACVDIAPNVEREPDARELDVANIDVRPDAGLADAARADVTLADVTLADVALADVTLADVALVDAATSDATAIQDAGLFDVALQDAPAPDVNLHQSEGCAQPASPLNGEFTFDVGGRTRRYFAYTPEGYSHQSSWPVVFALHGNGGDASYWNGSAEGRNVRALLENEAILVVVEAIDGNWRDYSNPDDWNERIDEELNYFDALIQSLESTHCVSTNKIFSMGFSGGASFSGLLACKREYIKAFAAAGAVLYFDPETCSSTSSAWVAISEGDDSPGRREFRDHFISAAGCASLTPPDEGCVAQSTCRVGLQVEACAYPGGHQWPSFGLQASWEFFESLD